LTLLVIGQTTIRLFGQSKDVWWHIASGRVLVHAYVLVASVGQLAVRVDRDQHVSDVGVDQLAVEASAKLLGDFRIAGIRDHHQVIDSLSEHAKHDGGRETMYHNDKDNNGGNNKRE
jgi:hypothetical protein